MSARQAARGYAAKQAPMQGFPIDRVRRRFPALIDADDGMARTFLDNPAGTQVPKSVADAAAQAMLHANANLGGFFRTSLAAEELVRRAHEAMAVFLNAASFREIVVAQAMTNLTFHISRSIGRMLSPGDEIVVTRMDHDGNIGPWLMLAEDLGLNVRWVDFDRESWIIEQDAFEAALTPRTKLVALNYASNLTGSVNNVAALTAAAKRAGALVYVDAVQYAPHGLIDVQTLGCDFLACSSYKFFGPHLGILWGREDLLERLDPYKVRPATSDLPWKFETGTPQIELQAALAATIDYFVWLGSAVAGEAASMRTAIVRAFDGARAWETHLATRLIEGIAAMPGVTIAGITDPVRYDCRVPTVSFYHERVSAAAIARALASENIFVWSGNNFALEIVRALDRDEEDGVVRIGAAHYNTVEEIDRVVAAVERALG